MKRSPQILALLVPLLLVLLAGCGGDGVIPPQHADAILVSATPGSPVAVDQLFQQMSSSGGKHRYLSVALGGSGTALPPDLTPGQAPQSLAELFATLYQANRKYVNYLPLPYAMRYKLTEGGAELSGLLVAPVTMSSGGLPVLVKGPMIALQHPTQTLRSQSPSNYYNNLFDDQLTIPVALLLSSMGYYVVAADYPGLGVNHETHPYCLKSLAQSVVGMITASRDKLKEYPYDSWDGRLFLMGFSEGGYATVATAQEIQQKHPELPVAAVAPLDGPYSLSDTMRTVMLTADTRYDAGYFLPYVIAGYGDAYGATVPLFKFATAIKDEPPAFSRDTLRGMLGGDYSGKQITEYMMKVSGYKGPSSVLTADVKAALALTSGPLYETLAANDAFRSWSPAAGTRMKFFHNIYDDYVPIGNFYNAIAAWYGLKNVEFESFAEYLPLGSVHAGALIPAYLRGILWIDAIAFPERH